MGMCCLSKPHLKMSTHRFQPRLKISQVEELWRRRMEIHRRNQKLKTIMN